MIDIPSVEEVESFRQKLLDWFYKCGRDYPWRNTDDPFKVLIAEIMLRRTKADQVKPVYEMIFSKYPDVESLAKANKNAIQEIMYPLGLRWRNAAFSLVAEELVGKYHGKVPETRLELISLPGVGDYVAGAVLSIGYGKREWIVDSNIVRLFKRYFGVRTSREGRRDKHMVEMAKIYVSRGDSRKANLAVLDFAALVCKYKNPACNNCLLHEDCKYEYLG